MAMVPYKGQGGLTTKKKKNKRAPWFDPNQLAYEFGLGAVDGLSNLAVKTFNGVVSAFQSKGASKSEIRAIVAPLAKQLSYTSRKPTFNKAEGGLKIEHIESIPLGTAGHMQFLVTTGAFRWLSNIAGQFEEYQIKLWFAWNPICPATTTGQVWMAFDYDPEDSTTGSYEGSEDYFNTADHCISAIWAPAAISPNKSGWLKTGENGDARLISPGRLHVTTTDNAAGFLSVKYQVALRKPQPDAADSVVKYSGSYTSTTDLFGSAIPSGGNIALVKSITSTTLTLAKTPGYKTVIWNSNDSSGIPTLTYATGTGGRTLGSRNGAFASYVSCCNPGAEMTVSLTASVGPSPSPQTWSCSIIQTQNNPTSLSWT